MMDDRRKRTNKLGKNGIDKDGEADENCLACDLSREGVGKTLSSTAFDALSAGVICLNAGVIGIEQSMEIAGQDTTSTKVIESLFLCFYIIELAMRFYAFGRSCIRDGLVVFDLVLVGFGVLTTWILEPLMGDAAEQFGALMLMRSARLLRVGKTTRLLQRVPAFWMMVRGLISFMSSTGLSLVIIGLILFVFGSFGVEVITKHALYSGPDPYEEFQRVVNRYFFSLPATMLTLIRFTTLDNMADVYEPLVHKDPWLCIYFIVVILVVSICLMNLLFASILTGAMEANQAESDDARMIQERDWANLVGNLKDIFTRLDEDKSGMLSLEEFLNIDFSDKQALCKALGCEKPIEIFKLLDTDKAGEISINYFFDGILDRLLATGATNFKRMERQIETMHWRLKESFAEQLQMKMFMDRLTTELAGMKAEMSKVQATMSSPLIPAGADLKPLNVKKIKEVEACSVGSTSTAASASESEAWEKELTTKLRALLEDSLGSVVERYRTQLPPRRKVASQQSAKKKGDAAEHPFLLDGPPGATQPLQPSASVIGVAPQPPSLAAPPGDGLGPPALEAIGKSPRPVAPPKSVPGTLVVPSYTSQGSSSSLSEAPSVTPSVTPRKSRRQSRSQTPSPRQPSVTNSNSNSPRPRPSQSGTNSPARKSPRPSVKN